jgi:hypothetical protein
MSPDCLLDGTFNNGYLDEGTRGHLDAGGKCHPLSCHHSVPQTHLQSLHWGKRDFGIAAAIIAGTAKATTAAVALIQTATMAKTVNAVKSLSLLRHYRHRRH